MENRKGIKKRNEKSTISKHSKSVLTEEEKLNSTKKKLLRAKAHYKKLAGEFIDQWVKVNKLKRSK